MINLPDQLLTILIKKCKRKNAINLLSTCKRIRRLDWVFYDLYTIKFRELSTAEIMFDSRLIDWFRTFSSKIRSLKGYNDSFYCLPDNITDLTTKYDTNEYLFDNNMKRVTINIGVGAYYTHVNNVSGQSIEYLEFSKHVRFLRVDIPNIKKLVLKYRPDFTINPEWPLEELTLMAVEKKFLKALFKDGFPPSLNKIYTVNSYRVDKIKENCIIPPHVKLVLIEEQKPKRLRLGHLTLAEADMRDFVGR